MRVTERRSISVVSQRDYLQAFTPPEGIAPHVLIAIPHDMSDRQIEYFYEVKPVKAEEDISA